MQPLVLSPKVWMCMPRLALASLPVMSQLILVGADSESCSKVTVPATLEAVPCRARQWAPRGWSMPGEAAAGEPTGREMTTSVGAPSSRRRMPDEMFTA